MSPSPCQGATETSEPFGIGDRVVVDLRYHDRYDVDVRSGTVVRIYESVDGPCYVVDLDGSDEVHIGPKPLTDAADVFGGGD